MRRTITTSAGNQIVEWLGGDRPGDRPVTVSRSEDYGGHREYALKRPVDVLLASFGFMLTLPAWIVLPLIIKVTDGGRVFYVQPRWGRAGKPFLAYKFRSMADNAEAVQARAKDPRITLIGRLMRRTALDELPQILNILKGDMSFVGPRSLPINERQLNDPTPDMPDDAIPNFDVRSRVRPGLTGLAQMYAPRDVSRRNKFRYDALYVRRQSLWLDLRLVFLSIWVSICGGWERRSQRTDSRPLASNFTSRTL